MGSVLEDIVISCDTCGGGGIIECPDCHGRGYREVSNGEVLALSRCERCVGLGKIHCPDPRHWEALKAHRRLERARWQLEQILVTSGKPREDKRPRISMLILIAVTTFLLGYSSAAILGPQEVWQMLGEVVHGE